MENNDIIAVGVFSVFAILVIYIVVKKILAYKKEEDVLNKNCAILASSFSNYKMKKRALETLLVPEYLDRLNFSFIVCEIDSLHEDELKRKYFDIILTHMLKIDMSDPELRHKIKLPA